MIQFKAKRASLIRGIALRFWQPTALAEAGDTTERGAGSMTGYQETPAAINTPAAVNSSSMFIRTGLRWITSCVIEA
jgi:hypothetical protein